MPAQDYEVTVNRITVQTVTIRVTATSHKSAVKLAVFQAPDHSALFAKSEPHSGTYQALGARVIPAATQASHLKVVNGG